MALSWTSLHRYVSKRSCVSRWNCRSVYIQGEGSVGRDETRETTRAVGVVAGDEESGLLAKGHSLVLSGADDALVPTCSMLAF
jgi:hypothetical protein